MNLRTAGLFVACMLAAVAVHAGEYEYCPPMPDSNVVLHQIKGFKTNFDIPRQTEYNYGLNYSALRSTCNGCTAAYRLWRLPGNTRPVPRKAWLSYYCQLANRQPRRVWRIRSKRSNMPGYGQGHRWERPAGVYVRDPDQYCWYSIRYNKTFYAGGYGSELTHYYQGSE